jgi:hypothetical protein
MIPRVLIATAFWPLKTPFFESYSNGIVNLLKTKKAQTQFFITTSLRDSKYSSNVRALQQAEKWALAYEFDYLLIVDADIVLKRSDFELMIETGKDVLLVGRGEGQGLHEFNLEDKMVGNIGWGCALINVNILRRFPFMDLGDFLSPDRMWFKKLLQSEVEIWCHLDIVPEILEESKSYPMSAFVEQKGG